jgi:hypothetical protein
MEIARDLFTVFSALPARFQQIQFGIPGRQRGRRHLGVRQSEDKSNGTRGRVWMQVETRKNPPPRKIGSQMKFRRPYSDGSKWRALKLDVAFLGQSEMRRLRI